jgi:GNAT superfamily N-acetyltransferase
MPGPGADPDLVTLSVADAGHVAELTDAGDRAFLPSAPPGWRPPRQEDECEWWERRLDRPEVWSRGLREHGGRLIGVVSMHPYEAAITSTGPAGHISALFVHPDRWRRGLGAMLLDLAEAEMRGRGWSGGRLLTPDWSPARVFYAKRGWLEDGHRDYIEHLDLDVVGLIKPL